MRKIVAMVIGAAIAGPALAQGAVEDGFERGALAAAAIDRGDWSGAEALLEARRGIDADDPARLINLGRVFMATGRPGEALSAWRLAAASPRPYMVATAGGRWISTRDLAAEAIARHAPSVRSASR